MMEPWTISSLACLDSIDERLLEYLDKEDDEVSLTEADLAYLRALGSWLGMYPEMRTTE